MVFTVAKKRRRICVVSTFVGSEVEYLEKDMANWGEEAVPVVLKLRINNGSVG
jgi:hypothetical protein